MTKRNDGRTGYGKPPTSGQFKKGQSGNKRGRPPRSGIFEDDFKKAAQEKVVINENGQRKQVSKLEAGAKHLANKVASGDTPAMKMLVQMMSNRGRSEPEPQPIDEQFTLTDEKVLEALVLRIRTEGDSQ